MLISVGCGADAVARTDSADGSCGLSSSFQASQLPALSFSAYHSLQDISDYLKSVAAALPAVAQYEVLGKSKLGADIPYLVINATCQANPPAMFANGTHHGDERAGTEASLALPDYLLRMSTTDPAVRALLDKYAFYVLPVVNPDGMAAGTRTDSTGADLNRDYSYPGRDDASSFKSVETQLIKSLQDRVGFRAAIAFHAGSQMLLWPWCYTNSPNPDDATFASVGERAAQAAGLPIYQQSSQDVLTGGEYIDYAYHHSHTLAVTFEVALIKTPSASALPEIIANSDQGAVAYVQAVSDLERSETH